MGAELVRTRPRAMQNRNDEPRLQHAPLRLTRKDDGRGRVNRRAMGVGKAPGSALR